MSEKYQNLDEPDSLKEITEEVKEDVSHIHPEEVLIEHIQPQTSETQENTKLSEPKSKITENPSENKENIETSTPLNKSKDSHLEKVRSSDNLIYNDYPFNHNSSKNEELPGKLINKSTSFYRLKAQKISENDKNFTHTEIFHQACLDRKKASFNSLKHWDLKRARFLTMHRNILETIQERLTEHVKNSQFFMQNLIKYLKDRANQELAYAKQIIEPFELQENPHYNERIYQILLKGLDDSAQKHQEHCRKVDGLGVLIEEKLLGESLLPEKSHYDKIIKEFNENLLRIKKNLTKMNIEASEKSAKFSTLYFTMINAPFGKKTDKDLYRREISFLRIANDQVKYQRKLAVEIFNFWASLKELETKRVEISKKAIELYLLEFNQAYPFLNNNEQNLGFMIENEEFLLTALEMHEILNQDEINSIITQAREFMINFDELNSEILKDFFEGFVIKPHGDEVLLTIKEAKAMRDVGGLISSYVECKLILTVDGFLICIDLPMEENEFKKPSMIVNLETTTSIKTKDVVFVEITRTKPGFLMNSMEKFSFKFGSKEEVEEMFEYLNRYYYK